MILTIAISGYRSLRNLVLPLEKLTVVTGANGAGKSSFYRALRLLSDVAQGRAIASLAAEGGLQSTIWAGPEAFSRGMKDGSVPVQGTMRKNPVALKLGFASEDYGYAIDLGLPPPPMPSPPPPVYFALDPEIKAEAVWAGEELSRRNVFAERRGPVVTALSASAQRQVLLHDLASFESMMTQSADPKNLPELLYLRAQMNGWRFYDHFRTDPQAPVRQVQVGTRTPVLSSDGADLAAAVATILEIGDVSAFHDAIEDAFPGSSVEIIEDRGRFELLMRQRGLLRPLSAGELSDGTLRYLLLVAALMTPRPPALMVLNEPETSLHPSLLAPLSRLIAQACKRSQMIVVSHAGELVSELGADGGALMVTLTKVLGETVAEGIDAPAWTWPAR
ncbi:AAA family ATPase [Neorhizobium sp. JUb45]|uniref:AAA family ATPase n=1 Tax=unclassified Neorhizobium TaxID=2629175 RepID=UPI0010503969|nr:AAA family ATPase [Neorhizobium sp. JUb45]TCR06554.1 putative ATPase [Neorhizobium sp. JUb45]